MCVRVHACLRVCVFVCKHSYTRTRTRIQTANLKKLQQKKHKQRDDFVSQWAKLKSLDDRVSGTATGGSKAKAATGSKAKDEAGSSRAKGAAGGGKNTGATGTKRGLSSDNDEKATTSGWSEKRQCGAGSKKKRTIIPKFVVSDRVLMGIYNNEDVVVAYELATVSAIQITGDGCIYTLLLDRNDAERTDVEEGRLFRSVEAV